MNIKKRNYNLDLLRIIACFMVVMLHVASEGWYTVPYNTIRFNVYNLFDAMTRSAVPLFVMISGVFFLSSTKQKTFSEIFKKYILKLLIIFIFWSIVYYFYFVYIGIKELDIMEFISFLITGPYHFWYIPMIIILYLISPILSKITVNSNKNLFKYFFILFMVGCLVYTIGLCNFLPGIETINAIISQFPIGIICQYYSYFLLGYFLNNYEISKKIEKTFYFLGVFSVILCTVFTYLSSRFMGISSYSFYSEYSIFSFLEAVALFLFFKNKKFISEEVYSDKIANISNSTLGVYILHVMVMLGLFHFNLININDFNPILSVPVISVITFLICLVATTILRKIKFINKWFL